MLKTIIILIGLLGTLPVNAQDKWQQRVKYKMDVSFDVGTNLKLGKN